MGNWEESLENSTVDLQKELEKRKMWFFECQLRRLNLDCFRDVVENNSNTESLLNLISESCLDESTPLGCRPNITRVYLDSRQPVWTKEERELRDKFKEITTGKRGSWLNYNMPKKLVQLLADKKELYEKSEFGSQMFDTELNKFGRKDPFIDRSVPNPPQENDSLEHIISKIAITEKKPWLIPEIFNRRNFDTSEILRWIENGEMFVDNFELELNELFAGKRRFYDAFTPDKYRKWVANILKDSVKIKGSSFLEVQFIDQSSRIWEFIPKIRTHAHQNLSDLGSYYEPLRTSNSVSYWINSCGNQIKEVYVHKSESDMGLCSLMRTLYLYGTLPSTFDVSWRNRKFSEKDTPEKFTKFHDFFQAKAKLAGDDNDLQQRLTTLKTKLQILLEETSTSPHCASIHFSPLAQEIIKQAVLCYKFWLDEPFHVYDYYDDDQEYMKAEGINKAKRDIGLGGDPSNDYDKLFSEMEFWSENHYIMFASSEYLAGQLWPEEEFQPARDFLKPDDKRKYGVVPGKQRADENGQAVGPLGRLERGRARVLKWLNNRLLFGWTEFNSSGYYREHLYALLNLADFAQDNEVRKKAILATDLLLFDLTRFSHKGSMGAAGGRSQFPSKNCGWDNAPGDLVEIMLGTRGIFIDRDSEIGCFFSTSSYRVPDVLLEIGSKPPDYSFVDRSRVSISFDEAPKYGIQISKKSDQRNSIEDGFASKRERHFKALDDVNKAITASHPNYEPWMDDTVFWWTMSGYFNKEIVRNTLNMVKSCRLQKCEVFEKLLKAVKFYIPLVEKMSHSLTGVAIGSIPSIPAMVTGVPFSYASIAEGAVLGFFADDFTDWSIIEEGSDDLAFFFDGSTRTRANILTYRNPDIMLSSLQNFRPGQLNLQSNVSQVTLNTSVNIFTTAFFSGLKLSLLETGLTGAVLGGAMSGQVAGAALGLGVGILAGAGFNAADAFPANHGDGPGWWTGYWALPMIIQHESAAILVYDFNAMQTKMAKVGSHTWFPTNGFDAIARRESSAYIDKNIVINDLFDIPPSAGQGGKWLFGKKIHQRNPSNPDDDAEAYIGVFSNEDPEFLDKDDDFYKAQIEEAKSKVEDFSSNDIFANKDWHVAKKNIWIIQVGNKKEFGSFEHFIDRVSRARIEIDDVGNMECTYYIPKPDGGTQVFLTNYGDDGKISSSPESQALSLEYGDGGKFTLNGAPFQNDFYPRFENPFVRGGRVEWGQREYVIEYNGKSLKHDFSDMNNPMRNEDDIPSDEDKNTVKGLVIYLKTGGEEMEVFTVATATVNIGCQAVAVDEVIAAGAVDENNYHDAEWIFFDGPALTNPDMTIDIAHHTMPGKGDDDTEWKMTFALKALMGDRSLKPCTANFFPSPGFYFRDEIRSTGVVPFSVMLLQWRKWTKWRSSDRLVTWFITKQPDNNYYYFDHIDQFGIDKQNILSHRTIGPCAAVSSWTDLNRNQNEPPLQPPYRLFSFSTQPGYLFLFLISNGVLYARWIAPGQSWNSQPWHKLSITYQPEKPLFGNLPATPPLPVPIWPLSFIYATFINYAVVTPAVYVSGMDGNIYVSFKWPLDCPGCWRKIETASVFKLLHTISFQITGNFLLSLDINRTLWLYPVTSEEEIFAGSWEQLPVPSFIIESFITALVEDVLLIVACSIDGTVWSLRRIGNETWQRVGKNIDFRILPGSQLGYATATGNRLDIFATGPDYKLYTTWWTEAFGWEDDHNWLIVAGDSQQFNMSKDGNMAVVSRVNGQIEIYATDSDQNIWKNWWS